MTIASDRHAKRWRKKEALKNFRRSLLARAKVLGGWKCERCRRLVRYECEIHPHHRLARSQGRSNCIGNGAALCWVCHRGVHDGFDDWRDWLVTRNTLRIDQGTTPR